VGGWHRARIRRAVFAEERFNVDAKTVTAAVVQNRRQLRRNERAERNEVEASENQITYQRMSETKRSEAPRLSEALLLMEAF